jgi:hypothetical protein
MTTYRGVGDVDPVEREKQRTLTKALWETLRKGGVQPGQPGRITSVLFAPSEAAADVLLSRFRTESGGWASDVQPRGDLDAGGDLDERLCVSILSPQVALTLDAFLELVDVMLVAAHETGCTFDGFELGQRGYPDRPWWRFW